MKQSVAVVVFALAGMALWAAPTSEIVDGRYVLTVPEGETYALTENDVTASARTTSCSRAAASSNRAAC